MSLNPMQILKLKEKLNEFRKRHPGFSRFILDICRKGLPADAIMEMKVIMPDGKEMTTNFRVTPEDIEFLRMIELLRQ